MCSRIVLFVLLLVYSVSLAITSGNGDYVSKYPPSTHNPVVVTVNGSDLYVIDVCLWNTESLDGFVEVAYSTETSIVTISASFSEVERKDTTTPIIGYPEVWIGCKPWWNPCANDWEVKFPTNSFSFEVEVKASLEKKKGVINVAFDFWFLTENDTNCDPSQDPKTIEVMFWLYYDHELGEWMIDKGAEVIVVPIVLNGVQVDEPFYFYYSKGTWNFIVFFPANRNLTDYHVKYSMEKLVEIIDSKHPELNIRSRYLAGVELGTEISAKPTDYTLKVTLFKVKPLVSSERIHIELDGIEVDNGTVVVNATLQCQDGVIEGAYYIIDSGEPEEIPALDGAYDSPIEKISVKVNASKFDDGYYTLSIRGYSSQVYSEWLNITLRVRTLGPRYHIIALSLRPYKAVRASDLAKAIGPSLTAVWKWNYEKQDFEVYIPGVSENDFELNIGEGYFIYLKSTVKWVEAGKP